MVDKVYLVFHEKEHKSQMPTKNKFWVYRDRERADAHVRQALKTSQDFFTQNNIAFDVYQSGAAVAIETDEMKSTYLTMEKDLK